jgi:ABC-2 type transport system permease protein
MSDRKHPIIELTIIRVKEMLREPEAIFWVFAFPVLLALALGFAFRNRGPEQVPVAIAKSCPPNYRAVLEKAEGLKLRVEDDATANDLLRTGRITIFAECSADGMRFAFDPTRPDARGARMELEQAVQRAAGQRPAVVITDRKVEAPGSRYIDFVIPGLLGMNLMGTGMWGIGFSVVMSRTKKLLKRLVATPMKKSDYLFSQILARLIFLIFEVGVLTTFGWLVFDVAVRGSIALFALICVCGAMCFAGIGLLVSSRAQTVEGVSGLMNLVMLPMWLLSGVFFASDRFPDSLQPFIQALPLTALNDALRLVMLEARGGAAVFSELAILAAWGIVSFAIAIRIFRWQ